MGIPGGSGSFGGSGLGWNGPKSNGLMFYGTMAAIRFSLSNPQPVPPALVSQAADILPGRIDPMQVYDQLGGQVSVYGQLPQELVQVLKARASDILPILKQLALILAALCVPQSQIPELLADPKIINPQTNILSGLMTILSNIFK